MSFVRIIHVICLLVTCMYWSSAHATEVEHSVVIEVVTNGMTADEVEQSIATPIELLMSNLRDVLLISAKYQDNDAEITVKFNQSAAVKAGAS